MALSYSRVARIVSGNAKERIIDFTADSAYTTGGYPLAASDFEQFTQDPSFNTTTSITFFKSEANSGGTSCVLDRTNSKLMFFLGGTECTTTISSKTVRARILYGLSNYK